MKLGASGPQPILVVEDEEVFASFLQHFPANRYLVLVAVGAAEAMALCESHSPRLMVVPLAGDGSELTFALRAVDHAGGKILGLTGPEATDCSPGASDRQAPSEDLEAIIAAARELLEERRQHPRVVVEFPVWFGSNRQGLARDLSRQSLVIDTTERLAPGEPLDLELHWGAVPRTIGTTVDRVRPTDMGRFLATLLVRPEDDAARAYLGEVVQKILEVEHYLHALEPGRLAVRGRAAWNLARRAEASLQKTSELGLSGDGAPGPAEAATASPAPPAGSLWTRYQPGLSRGRWGVGEIKEAKHRLLQRRVLVKQLATALRQDPEARTRLEAEATAASAVRNECIADVLDFGEDGEGGLFYAMEWLEGVTLAEALSARTTFSVMDVARLGVHLAFALTVAHRQGVRHWDLCPEHIFLHRANGVLSLPKLLALSGPPQAPPEPPRHAQGLAFRPPGEAAMKTSPQWDTFALCRVLGRIQPADGSSPQGERLKALFSRGTSSDPTRRFDSMSSLCRALHQILNDEEAASKTGPDPRIVPAVLPAEANLFRMSSTGLPIPMDAPAPLSWPRGGSRSTPAEEGAADLAPAKAPALPPARRGPQAQTLKKTLFGVPAAAPLLAKQPSETGTPGAAAAPLPQAAPPPGDAPSLPLPPELEPAFQKVQDEEFEEATTNVVPVGSPSDKKTLLGLATTPPKSNRPTPERPAPATPAKPAATPAKPAATSAKPAATPAFAPAPAPATSNAPSPAQAPSPALAPAALIASVLGEDAAPNDAAGSGGPWSEGHAPLEMDVPSPSPAIAPVASQAPGLATPRRRRRALLLIGVGVLALAGLALGLYLALFAGEHKPKPAKRGDALAQGAAPPRRPAPAPAERKERAAPPPPDAAAPRSEPPRDPAPRTDTPDASLEALDPRPRQAADDASVPAGPEPDPAAHLSPREREQLLKKQRLENRLEVINKARALMRRGQHAEARHFLSEALKMWDSPRLRMLFAQSYSALGETWPAIHHQRRAVALAPGSVTHQLTLGQLYLKVGQRSPACAAFRAARTAKPEHAQAKTLAQRYCGK